MKDTRRTLRRRAFLGGVAAGMVGIAGCSVQALESDDDSAGTPEGTPQGTPAETPRETRTDSPTPADSAAAIPTYPYRETGVEPLDPEPAEGVLNPVLEPGHVTDVNAEFVADPFVFVTDDGEWHMFFEVETGEGGVIAHATSDDRGRTWSYDRVVLRRPYHLSFPYVFKWDGEFYMTTQEGRTNPEARLYRATGFPHEWTHAVDIYDPTKYDHAISDHVLFRWEGRWWSLASDDNADIHLYHSESLTDDGWQPHENNPVVEDRKRAARPAGRPIVRDDHVLVFYQDNVEFYGEKVRAYRVTDLTTSSFADEEVSASPVLDGTDERGAWNGVRMHHYDPWYLGEGEGWRVAVDGNGDGGWSIGIYDVPE